MNWLKGFPHWIVWGLALPLMVLNGWLIVLLLQYFQSLVTIFIGATVLSFILDYPIRRLQQRDVARFHAIVVVFLLALSFFLLLAITIIPIAFEQLNDLVTRLPLWLESTTEQVKAVQNWAIARRFPVDWNKLAFELEETLSFQLQVVSTNILSFGLGLVGSALDFTLMIVVTFYMLLYGDRFWTSLLQWLPSKIMKRLRRSLRTSFHNYFIGQATLASLMGLSMIVTFLILQVPFGLLFGLVIGIMTLFPFGAVFSIWVISLLIALGDFWTGTKILVIALLIDQSIESGIAPRLLGRFTGLNPVWVLFVLLLGVRVGGLLGLLIAVPIAGFVKNVVDSVKVSGDQEVNVESQMIEEVDP